MISFSIMSKRRALDFNTRQIIYYAKDLNLRKYYLEMLKKAKFINPHNPESDIDNPDNIFKIVFNVISQLNVNMARIFKQMYQTFDNDLEIAWKQMLVIEADEYAL